MKDVVEEFERTVEEAARRLLALGEAESGRRPAGGGWSAKETVGHLIDSAANNHQRFVRAQARDDLVFDGYEQDAWIAAQHYQDAPWGRLVELWRLYNLHLAHVVARVPEGELRRPRHPHSLHRIAFRLVDEAEPATLEYLIRDYVEHLKHHLKQIETMSAERGTVN
ncbi:MAG: DinB family protein [Acidobacteriota bacterium]|nr:DinB family protein [Acidobacteriota bacterium]